MKISVPNMSCDHCKAKITNALESTGGVENIVIDLEAKIVTVDTSRSFDEISNVIVEAGYIAAEA